MLILYLSRKKEKYTATKPFSLKCNWKQVKTESVKPILHLYIDDEHCTPSQQFRDLILTKEVQDMFSTYFVKDLNKFSPSNVSDYPFIEKIKHTPTIIIEYPNVENDEQKNKIINEGAKLYEGNKYLFVIDSLSIFTPDEDEEEASKREKKDNFIKFITTKIIS
jgi:hypothetical protein